jgi:hypothetical protein
MLLQSQGSRSGPSSGRVTLEGFPCVGLMDSVLLRREEAMMDAVLGKHPDISVGPPTGTVFPTNDRKYKNRNFSKNFSKRFKPKPRPKSRHLVETAKRSYFFAKKKRI